MPKTMKNTRPAHLFAAAALSALAAASPAMAADAGDDVMPSTLALLEAMVQSGVIDIAQAQEILQMAKARDAERAVKLTPPPVKETEKRVVYVPEIVKQELRDEIKAEVMQQAEAENWAAPNSHPEWTERIKFSGDLRGRYEGIYFPEGNPTGVTVDFNAINQGNGAKLVAGSGYLLDYYTPEQNVDEDRQRTRLRARIGMDADLGEGFATNIRLATGSGNSPVSTNQSLGGSGGNFSKYEIWLDRAALHWDALKDKDKQVTVDMGRFDNPFFGTDLVWDGDLGFDGLNVSGTYDLSRKYKMKPFATVGAFPVYNTSFNLASYQLEKTPSHDKWLLGAQAGSDWKPRKDLGVKFGAGYYHFNNIEGELSSPCADAADSSGACDTDATRPSFAQKGNTYMALRDLTPVTSLGTSDAYQYYGLATPFRELALTGRADYTGLETLRVSLDGEVVKNLAFDKKEVAAKAVNNFDDAGEYDGGDLGYLMRLTVGSPKMEKRWDWNTSLAYKYVESDAVVDGFTDSDFGLGGTNLKGFILGGNLKLARNVGAGLRWMSADNVGGVAYSVDIIQADVAAKF
mgnify:CR=1 FL=1